ncbi:MAG: dihydroorotase [Eubacterium sp.]|nr:dihydroorotase [Eubacterium sp.]
MKFLLKNGYAVDYADDFEGKTDILIEDGIIAAKGENLSAEGAEVIDCEGLTVLPGLCDMHVHLRDPGQTYKEDVITGCAAAAAGGVTAVVCMPNTVPAADTPEVIEYILDKAKSASAKVYPVGCITKGLKGEELCDYNALKAAGCVAVSDDGRPVEAAAMMESGMKGADAAGLAVISHCEDLKVINGGIINDGEVSRQLGVKGMSRLSEDTVTARELAISRVCGVPIHIAHVSTEGSADLIRAAKSVGIKCTCETGPHYFTLTDEKLLSRDADYRMNPPLRTEADRQAIINALVDGTIDCIITDHAPHSAEDKADFEKAPNGVVGLETSLAATLTELYHKNVLTLKDIVKLMCVNPRKILGIPGGSLRVGEPADIAIADINEQWTVDPVKLHSKSHNSCFKGMTFKGKVKYTFLDGKSVYKD